MATQLNTAWRFPLDTKCSGTSNQNEEEGLDEWIKFMLKWELEGGQKNIVLYIGPLAKRSCYSHTYNPFMMSLWFSGVLAWHNVYPLTVILITMQRVDVLGMFLSFLFLFL